METRGKIIIILMMLGILIPIVTYVTVFLPANAQYNKKFASKVTMAYDQATFEGMKEQVLELWKEMNNTFSGFNYSETYNTPWYWEQTYDNSLAAQQDYFRQLVNRLDSYIELYQKMTSNTTNPVYLEDWYHNSIQNFRVEMKREGGLDWAIEGAWYLNFAPLAYWWLYYSGIFWVIVFVLIIYTIVTD